MNAAGIEQLIERYYQGNTNEVEEFQLREYFSGDDILESHMEAKLYFQALDSLVDLELDEGFDEQLMELLVRKEKTPGLKNWTLYLTSAAAVILLMLTIWFGTDLLQPKKVYGTISDPKLAFAETQKVLDEVSKKMNKGLQPAKKTVDKMEDNVRQVGEIKKMRNALNKAQKVNKFEKASELLKSFSKVQVRMGNS